jgi:hypothetical protein
MGVSVVISTNNRSGIAEKAIRSALSQTPRPRQNRWPSGFQFDIDMNLELYYCNVQYHYDGHADEASLPPMPLRQIGRRRIVQYGHFAITPPRR